MSTVKFVPKAGKPHIAIVNCIGPYFLWPSLDGRMTPNIEKQTRAYSKARDYCTTVNDSEYKTQGEAARALHNYKGE